MVHSVTVTAIASAIAFACVLYNIVVMRAVFRHQDYSLQQKVAQAILLWLIPMFGAALVHWFIRNGTAELPDAPIDPFGREHEPPE
jgi:Na+/serine symporter